MVTGTHPPAAVAVPRAAVRLVVPEGMPEVDTVGQEGVPHTAVVGVDHTLPGVDHTLAVVVVHNPPVAVHIPLEADRNRQEVVHTQVAVDHTLMVGILEALYTGVVHHKLLVVHHTK